MHLTMNNSANQSNILIQITKPERKDNFEIFHVFCIIIAVVAFLPNSSLCLLHACCKKVRRISNIFLITHYIANTLQTLTAIMLFAWPNNVNALLCALNVSFSCSVLCVPVISLMTLFKTQWANRFSAFLSGNLSYVLLVVMLSTGVGVAIPPFLGWGSPILIIEYPTSISISYSLFAGSFLIVVPLIFICYTNYKLFSRVRSYERRAKRENDPRSHGIGRLKFEPRRREGEAKWVAILQVVVFVLCLLPITVENVLASFVPHLMPEVLKYSFNCLALAYCLMSPILYGLTNREVRQAFKCCCYQKTFVLQGHPRKQGKRGKMSDGCYRMGTKDDPFVIQGAEQSCDELTGSYDLDCAGRERFVHFVGISMEFSTGDTIDDVSRPQLHNPVIRKKRPITTEVSPVRRHSTLRKQDDAPKRRPKVNDSTKVHFEEEYTDKQRKKYIATPSIKRMRQIKNSMSNMSETDLQSSIASLSGYEFESQQHKAPHFTNYSDPMRSAGFRQVLTGKGNMARTCSLHRGEKYKPNIRKFMERRCSTEGDNAIRIGSEK